MILPPADYLKRMWQLCRDHDIVYVSDEVVTGFGRLGEWFASESVFGIVPDIITSAKGLTSGYLPLGATIISDRIYDVISPRRATAATSPWATRTRGIRCRARRHSRTSRSSIARACWNTSARSARTSIEQLATLGDLPMVGDVRGSHLMACVEFVEDRATRRHYPEELDVGKLVANACEPRGLIVRPMVHLNVMSPPLVIDRDDVDRIVSTLRDAIVEVRALLES